MATAPESKCTAQVEFGDFVILVVEINSMYTYSIANPDGEVEVSARHAFKHEQHAIEAAKRFLIQNEFVVEHLRPQILPADIESALAGVQIKLADNCSKHGMGAFVSPHEALGVITEEFYELLDVIHCNAQTQDELYDLAAAVVFAIASHKTWGFAE